MINYNAALPAMALSGRRGIDVNQWINDVKGNLTALARSMFARGEQGIFLDPNDLSTLYQDAAGTIPVTAAGQPVGLMLDKSKGLGLGGELIIGGSFEDGLIGTKSEGLGSVSTWELNTTDTISGTKDGKLTITTASATRPTLRFPVASNAVMGKTYRLTFNYKVTSGVAIISQLNNGSSATTVVNKTLTGSGTFVASIPWQGESTVQPYIYFGESIATIQIDNVSFKELVGNHAYQAVSASRPILQQSPILGNEVVSDTTFKDSSYWTLTGTGWAFSGGKAVATNATGAVSRIGLLKPNTTYEFVIRVVREAGSLNLPYDGQGPNIQTVGQSGTYTRKLTTSQYPNFVAAYGNNFTGTVEFVSAKEVTGYRTDQNYLQFDGVDDFLQTNNIDFTATDKISLFAGVRKLSDAASAALVELSANSGANNGAFALWSPLTALPNYAGFSRGTLSSNSITPSNYPSPNSAVLSAKYSIDQDVNALRLNSIQAAQNPADQGTGNYGKYPLYIGRRGGTSLPFNGHIYSLIGIGRLTTDTETKALEKELAKRTGVTLNV